VSPGDVIVTNHPAFGGSHLPDVTVISPVYSESGTHIGFVANRAHHAEIGGIRPGSMPPSANCLAQEGVVLPPSHLFRNSKADWDAMRSLFTSAPYPSRNPDENIADLQAAVAANLLGEDRLKALSLTIGEIRLRDSMVDLRQYAAKRMRDEVALWDWDHTEAEEMLDDGSILKVKLQRTDDHVSVDFTGSSDVHKGNLNATPAIVHSVIMYVMRTLISEDMPLNEGIMEPVKVILPQGLLNPTFTDDPFTCPAVVGGNVETSQRLVDTILKAFGVIACSQGTMNNLLFGNERFGYYETICGGTGAGSDFNGADGVHHHMTNTRITDPEILEWRYPVRLEQFGIRRGSGGQGAFRGGDGIVRKLRFKEAVDLSIVSQHRKVAPYGIDGGGAGLTGRQWIERKNGDILLLEGIDQSSLEAGDAFVIETPGGGGFGST
jgi:5-oxoprolinase (ATP-hydrolysing)